MNKIDALFIASLMMIFCGVGLWWHTAALISGGVIGLVVAILFHSGKNPPNPSTVAVKEKNGHECTS
jgi:hypothetical protein